MCALDVASKAGDRSPAGPSCLRKTWLRYRVPRRAPPDLRAGNACLSPAQAEPGYGYPFEVLITQSVPSPLHFVGGRGALSLLLRYNAMQATRPLVVTYCGTSTPRHSWPRRVDAYCGVDLKGSMRSRLSHSDDSVNRT